jgi:4-carboxymuconolactone decarboxylase
VPEQTAVASFEDVNAYPPAAPPNVFRQAAIDVIFGQVWTRPGLTRRQRRWVSLTGAGLAGPGVGLSVHLYGALNSGDISVAEMGEFLLQFACYAGWPQANPLDAALREALGRIAAERGEAPDGASAPAFDRLDETTLADLAGPAAGIRAAVLGPAAGPAPHGTPVSDLLAGGLEYGQVWSRPQLARADRRLIAITLLAKLGYPAELRAHVAAAAGSGDFSLAALREVALHAGFYAGLMAGRAIDQAISEAAGGRANDGAAVPR